MTRPVLAQGISIRDGKIEAPPSVGVQMVVPEDEFAPSLPRPCHRAHDISESFQRIKRWQGRQTHARLRCDDRATKFDRARFERLKRAYVEAR